MLDNGIGFNRYVHPDGLPMHNKFMLFKSPQRRIVTFGSMNLSVRSLHANHELLVIDETPELYQVFERRWVEMLMEARICGECAPVPLDKDKADENFS
jgi:phosphatidylserine/phosphatidylglycerophosphate/cardiolipin synthase-like enzyme